MKGLFIALGFIILVLGWDLYEKFTSQAKEQPTKTVVQGEISESTKPKIVLYNREPCAKPKVRHRLKVKKAKPIPRKTVVAVGPVVAPQPVAQPVIPTTPSAVVETAEPKPLLGGTDPDYGKTVVEFTPLPEKEAPPKRRRVVVVEQSPYYYGGGYYNTGYQYPYYYTQPVFTPAPQVITPAPSVVTPAPSVVRPPSVVTGPAVPGVVTRGPPSVVTR